MIPGSEILRKTEHAAPDATGAEGLASPLLGAAAGSSRSSGSSSPPSPGPAAWRSAARGVHRGGRKRDGRPLPSRGPIRLVFEGRERFVTLPVVCFQSEFFGWETHLILTARKGERDTRVVTLPSRPDRLLASKPENLHPLFQPASQPISATPPAPHPGVHQEINPFGNAAGCGHSLRPSHISSPAPCLPHCLPCFRMTTQHQFCSKKRKSPISIASNQSISNHRSSIPFLLHEKAQSCCSSPFQPIASETHLIFTGGESHSLVSSPTSRSIAAFIFFFFQPLTPNPNPNPNPNPIPNPDPTLTLTLTLTLT